jgi:tRNA pseudouridine38-40 synthase
MHRACEPLVGRHDFGAFYTHQAEDDVPRETMRRVLCAHWARDGGEPRLARFQIEADAFLRHMVRAIVGSAILVGLRKLPEDAIADMLDSRDRRVAGPTAPATGLTLLEVTY